MRVGVKIQHIFSNTFYFIHKLNVTFLRNVLNFVFFFLLTLRFDDLYLQILNINSVIIML